ncbi:MAG: hypothetical protein JO026_04105 [Patescibacteria group bacterium]|nr:hypothetical protein [Patescibacteria group bacterium]
MKRAGDFLSKFQNITPPDEAVRSALARITHEIVGIPLSKKDVTISRGVAFIECSSIAKSALHLNRAAILSELFEELPKARDLVRDLR